MGFPVPSHMWWLGEAAIRERLDSTASYQLELQLKSAIFHRISLVGLRIGNQLCQLIGLREKLQEHPIFHRKIHGFRLRCSLSRQPISLCPVEIANFSQSPSQEHRQDLALVTFRGWRASHPHAWRFWRTTSASPCPGWATWANHGEPKSLWKVNKPLTSSIDYVGIAMP